MSKPCLLAVDDDISVLETVVQDLRSQYGADYRILRAGSGPAALDICRQLQERGDQVALILSDQRMPGMMGVDLLEKTRELFPDAKRVLLTAYADTEAAIRAINSARIHYYLTKPWDPPEEKLYPVLDDLLDDWKQEYRPGFEGLKVVGPRWGRNDYQVRDFLSRNQIPYQWFDPDQTGEALTLLRSRGLEDSHLPVVFFPDGSYLIEPDQSDLAVKAGLPVQAKKDFYDLVVIGAGPAGLAAGVYGASEGLKTLVLEPSAPGGQAGSSSRIENYLGFPSGVTGAELSRRALVQAKRFGAEFVTQRATAIRTEGPYHFICLADEREVSTHACLVATGVNYRRLQVEGMDRLTGRGIYYGAALVEARSCGGEDVYLVGGANSAGQAAMHFSRYARRVTMLVRAESLEKSMSKYLIEQISATSNITVEPYTEVIEAVGENRLEAIRVRGPEGESVRKASSLFIFIGAVPQTDWLPETVMRDSNGFVLSGNDLKVEGKLPHSWPVDREPYLLESSVPGIFVAGDVRHGSIKRVASAVGEGSIVVRFVHQYLAQF